MQSDSIPRPPLAAIARGLLAWQHRRAAIFAENAALFGDPAWQVLLDLYVEAAAGRRVSVSSACIAAGVPSATALRWLQRLEAAGLIARTADTEDRRRAFLSLTAPAQAAMERWLEGAPLPSRPPPF